MTIVAPGSYGGRDGTSSPALDSFMRMHNNTVMNSAQLAPVIVLLNIAGSSGATG